LSLSSAPFTEGTSHAIAESTPDARREHRLLAYGALLMAVLGISWSAIFIRWSAVPGPSSAFYRVFIAALVLAPLWTLSLATNSRARRRLREGGARAAWLACLGGAFFGLDLALYNTAVMMTTATEATLFGNNAPVFVGFGTWLIFRRRPKRAYWAGLALAAIGGAMVMIDGVSRQANAGSLAGDCLALIASIFFAAYLLTTEHVREMLDTLTFSTLAIAGSVVTLLIVCLVLEAPLAGFSRSTWAALLGLGLVSQLAAYFALVYALGHLPATLTSVGLLAQVPLTALLAIPLLGEPLHLPQVAGAALVLAGIYIVNRR
jgi:drug/metabolite transporter (DMT)-like permease